MQIQVNSDKNITVSSELSDRIEQKLQKTLKHLSNKVTRIEVHLSDENSIKGGADDKKCLLEARIAKRTPITTEYNACTIDQALNGASKQLVSVLRSVLGKMQSDNRQRNSIE